MLSAHNNYIGADIQDSNSCKPQPVLINHSCKITFSSLTAVSYSGQRFIWSHHLFNCEEARFPVLQLTSLSYVMCSSFQLLFHSFFLISPITVFIFTWHGKMNLGSRTEVWSLKHTRCFFLFGPKGNKTWIPFKTQIISTQINFNCTSNKTRSSMLSIFIPLLVKLFYK